MVSESRLSLRISLLDILASALTEVGLTSVVKSVDSDHLMRTPTNKFLSISTKATNGMDRKFQCGMLMWNHFYPPCHRRLNSRNNGLIIKIY
jgi:hypothetical protein